MSGRALASTSFNCLRKPVVCLRLVDVTLEGGERLLCREPAALCQRCALLLAVRR